MRIYELLHEVIVKFAPMDSVQAGTLKNDAAAKYGKLLDSAETIVQQNEATRALNEQNKDNPEWTPKQETPLTRVQKAVWFSNQWWARYVFAILFIVIVPMIKNYINGQKDEPEDEEQSMLERFMEFERLNKRS